MSRMMPNPLLIVNPHAGQKIGIQTNPSGPHEIRAALAQHGLRVDMQVTEGEGHATELASEAVRQGAELVIAAGGDGTVHEVACALIGTETTLGIAPLGSIMNIARALHVPRDLDAAASVISAGRIVHMDVGKATTRTRTEYFLEAAGVGVDAAIGVHAMRLDAGDWWALLPLLRAAFAYVPRPTRLVVDGRGEVVRPHMITVAISPFTGPAMAFAPDAKVDDRQFDIVVREGFGGLELARHALSITRARRAHHPNARTLRGRLVEVRPMYHKLMAHADGHGLGLAPVRFELVPGALRVLAGGT